MSPRAGFSRLVLVTGVLVVGQLVFVSWPASDETACAALTRWAQRYEHARPTLAELAALDRPHRVAAFTVLAAPVKAALWREHLERFAERPELSATQRALLDRERARLTPAVYEQAPDAAAASDARLTALQQAFTTQQLRALSDLGSVVQPASTGLRWRELLGASVVRAQAPLCFCNPNWWNYDCGAPVCVPSAGSCQVTWSGCGPMWEFRCVGLCQW